MNQLIPLERVESKILVIRDQKVMLDRDLAELYGVTTGNLNKAVSRNLDRFPPDFMFTLSPEELKNLIFQNGTSRWGGTRKLPRALTEQGVAMLSSVLHSTRAVQVNILIMRAFVKMREMLQSHQELRRKVEAIFSPRQGSWVLPCPASKHRPCSAVTTASPSQALFIL